MKCFLARWDRNSTLFLSTLFCRKYSLFPARLHSSELLHPHSCFQNEKVPRFVATALEMGAAWKTKKKSIIFLFFPPVFALLSWGQGDGEGRAGWGSGDRGVKQRAASQEGAFCSPLGRQGCPGLAVCCRLVEALSPSRACDQSLPDAWRVALISLTRCRRGAGLNAGVSAALYICWDPFSLLCLRLGWRWQGSP